MTRVFMTADAVGGVWTYATELSAGLSDRGLEVTLATLGPAPKAAQRSEAERAGVRLIETALPLDWMEEDVGVIAGCGEALASLAKEHRADVVHLNTPALAARARFDAPVVGACHSCLATWWRAMRSGDMPASFAARTNLLSAGYRASSALIAPSEAFAAQTRAIYGVAPVAVRNGRAAAGRRAEAAAKEPFAFTSGRLWDEAKNFAAVSAAAAHMRSPLIAAGALRGPNNVAVDAGHVRALGHLDAAALDGWLNRAAVFVSLARYEPFGLGVLEAAQAGCALVLSDIPSFRELWSGAALFVPHDNERFVAETLDYLLANEEPRRTYSERATARAQRYSRDAMVEATLAVYVKALACDKAVA